MSYVRYQSIRWKMHITFVYLIELRRSFKFICCGLTIWRRWLFFFLSCSLAIRLNLTWYFRCLLNPGYETICRRQCYWIYKLLPKRKKVPFTNGEMQWIGKFLLWKKTKIVCFRIQINTSSLRDCCTLQHKTSK